LYATNVISLILILDIVQVEKMESICSRLQQELQDSKDQKTYFLKIHAPWDVLATYADVLKIKVPFKESDIPHGQEVPLDWLSLPFRLPGDVMNPQPDYFTYHFDKTKTDFFLINDKDTFFPPSTRNRIVSLQETRSFVINLLNFTFLQKRILL